MLLLCTLYSTEDHAIYLAVVGMGSTPHHLSANTILMAPSLSFLLVFLFCMWQIEALPGEAIMVGEGGCAILYILHAYMLLCTVCEQKKTMYLLTVPSPL